MLITLLTDFGSRDYFVGAMKGVLLSRCAGAVIVDLTHEIPPQDVHAAAFTLLAAHAEFPPGTVHVAVVDPGVGSARRVLAGHAGGQYFVGPDNGLLGWVLDAHPGARVHAVEEERYFRDPVSTTFHGRDVFAPVAAAVARGTPLEALGERVEDYLRLEPLRPVRDGDVLRASIIHIDRFGNCVTSLTPADLRQQELAPGGTRLEVKGVNISELRRFYAEREETGTIFGIWGSAGFLELVAFRESAARLLGARRGDTVLVRGA